ncbi:MAG: terminase small subunit, partial [Gemmiger sp.]
MARPLKYKTVDALQAAIDAYFEDCQGKPLLDKDGTAVTDKYGEPVIIGAHPPTVTGLALALGFTGRQVYPGSALRCLHQVLKRRRSIQKVNTTGASVTM